MKVQKDERRHDVVYRVSVTDPAAPERATFPDFPSVWALRR
jgi:hypothetical protein